MTVAAGVATMAAGAATAQAGQVSVCAHGCPYQQPTDGVAAATLDHTAIARNRPDQCVGCSTATIRPALGRLSAEMEIAGGTR